MRQGTSGYLQYIASSCGKNSHNFTLDALLRKCICKFNSYFPDRKRGHETDLR